MKHTMDKHHACGATPHIKLGLDTVDVDAVLEACELVGRVLRGMSAEQNARTAARLLTEASRDEHHDALLTRSILVEVARALQRRDCR